MKTAMQELIELLELNTKNEPLPYLIDVIKEVYIQKEKEQIKDAWDAGMSEGIGTTMADLDWDGEFINYYNETYNQDNSFMNNGTWNTFSI
jgi:hypothetical protein